MKLTGYARVSTDEQTLDLQRDALVAAGCTHVHEDLAVSGASHQRPGLDEALASLKKGHVLVVWKLDRLGRSMPHLVQLLADLGRRDIGFRSLTEAIDTTSAHGKLLFHIMGALAEFERSLLIERTRAGITAARKRGQHVGRPRAMTGAQITHARALLDEGKSPADVAAIVRVARSTLYRTLGPRAARGAA